MKKKIISFLLVLSLCFSFAACGSSGQDASETTTEVSAEQTTKVQSKADTVVYGTIYTVDESQPDAEAMAIKDGKIIYIGDKEGAQEYVDSGAAVEDYSGDFIMPGIIDGHIHDYVDAENKAGLQLKTGNTSEQDLVQIAQYIAEHPDEKIYKGFGWTDNSFSGTPTAAMLDAICPDIPIYIKSEDCHSCWVNTAMMEKCGITAETEDPIGGVIERVSDTDPTPNGCFRDTAMDNLIKPYVDAYSSDEYKEMLLGTQQTLLSYGVTAYDEVIIDPSSADNICKAYHELEEEGTLKIKVNCAILVNNTDDYVEKLNHVKELKDEYDGDTFRITDVKIFMDGIVESETAYVSEPYTDGKTGADRWPGQDGVERLYDLTTRVNDLGLVAHFHAIGDAAITKALDAIEYAQEHSVNKDIRNCITHFQMVKEEDIKRFADLHVIAVANLGWAASANEDIGFKNVEEENVGQERNNAMYPFKSLIDAGVTLSYATDYPAGPIDYPYYNLPVGITRMAFGVESTQRNADECLSSSEALEAMTAGGAYQLGREDSIGSLSVGKCADFIVLNNNLATMDPNDILTTTQVIQTYVDGQAQIQE